MTEPGKEVQLSKKTLDEFARMATALEEYDAGGGDGILQEIFAANTVDDYNKILGGERALPMNKSIKVERVRYAQSDFNAGLPFYLVIDGVDMTNGEVGQWVSGAQTVVAMLTRAAFAGHLPVIGRAYESAKPTKDGFTPVNWTMEAIGGNGQQELDVKPAAKK